MPSGFIVHLNSPVSVPYDPAKKFFVRQNPDLSAKVHSIFRLSYWLAALVLGLASASVANAASLPSEDRGEIDPMGLVKPEITKTPRPSPSSFLGLIAEGLENPQIQPPTLTSGAESSAVLPETLSLQNEDLRTDGADLMLETSEVSVPAASASPALPNDSTGLEIEFGFPGSTQKEGLLDVDPATLSLGEGTAADRFSGAVAPADLITQAVGSADEMPWRFSFEPFFYLPFGANGDITVRGINAPINAGIGDIFDTVVNDLNFAAFGRAEAWNGPWGIFFSGAYTNLGTGRTADIPVPPVLQQVGLPPQTSVSAATGTSFVQLDLGGAYRFGDGNLPTVLRTADTEFDLGPFIFDALAGVRLYSFRNNLVLTGPLGNQFEFDQSNTIVEPMIGGRARWNLSPNLAALASANMSGFGIGNLTFSAAGFAGIDWLFSGNTSLLASYGFTYLNYSSGNSGLDLFTHGPRIGVKFRF